MSVAWGSMQAVHYPPAFPPIESTYQSYCQFCRRDGVIPLPIEGWLKARELPDYSAFCDVEA